MCAKDMEGKMDRHAYHPHSPWHWLKRKATFLSNALVKHERYEYIYLQVLDLFLLLDMITRQAH